MNIRTKSKLFALSALVMAMTGCAKQEPLPLAVEPEPEVKTVYVTSPEVAKDTAPTADGPKMDLTAKLPTDKYDPQEVKEIQRKMDEKIEEVFKAEFHKQFEKVIFAMQGHLPKEAAITKYEFFDERFVKKNGKMALCGGIVLGNEYEKLPYKRFVALPGKPLLLEKIGDEALFVSTWNELCAS